MNWAVLKKMLKNWWRMFNIFVKSPFHHIPKLPIKWQGSSLMIIGHTKPHSLLKSLAFMFYHKSGHLVLYCQMDCCRISQFYINQKKILPALFDISLLEIGILTGDEENGRIHRRLWDVVDKSEYKRRPCNTIKSCQGCWQTFGHFLCHLYMSTLSLFIFKARTSIRPALSSHEAPGRIYNHVRTTEGHVIMLQQQNYQS